jgi:hypothetical protein
MKKTELRIGNYVKEISGKICEVSGIGEISFIYLKTENGHLVRGIEKCFPIKLTEEILKEFGFEEDASFKHASSRHKKYYKGYDIVLYFRKPRYYYYIECVNRDTTRISILKYLHELQNLYFAFSGEELERIENQ